MSRFSFCPPPGKVSLLLESSVQEQGIWRTRCHVCTSVPRWSRHFCYRQHCLSLRQWKWEYNWCFLNVLLSVHEDSSRWSMLCFEYLAHGLTHCQWRHSACISSKNTSGMFLFYRAPLVRVLMGNGLEGSHSARHLAATATSLHISSSVCATILQGLRHREGITVRKIMDWGEPRLSFL